MNFFKNTVIFAVLSLACAAFAAGQSARLPEPRQEKLLNGMKLLVWNEPRAEKATVKLRIHNGAAFDPKDKMGVMALLADILFPTDDAKSFFSEELEGSLDITANYDYLQITITSRSNEIQAILETLATAATNPQITQENFALVRDARMEKVRELEKNPSYVADRAVAQRLFGEFPYGRSIEGTTESLTKIDRADLLLARDRFLTADNATLAVVGNVRPDFVYRAARQLFGGWRKSERKIPATFRLPDAPDTKEFLVEFPGADKYFSRTAAVTAARNDKDFYATQILTRILQKQFCLNDDEKRSKSDYQPYLLRGVYLISQNTASRNDVESLPVSSGACQLLAVKDGRFSYPAITQGDFEAAKAAVVNDYRQKTQNLADLAEFWLDVDTYRLAPVKDEMAKLNNVTLADVQRAAENLRKQPTVKIIVKKPETNQ
jgi:zinc protease